ncbi:MAG: hypothetical protein M3P18_10160 [Actinomycetota bacterium]|nr:hypothetical protein [Actinomycetota bacterium]
MASVRSVFAKKRRREDFPTAVCDPCRRVPSFGSVLKLSLTFCLVGAPFTCSAQVLSGPIKQRNLVQIENSRTGSPGWSPGLMDASTHVTNAPVQGYASEVSAMPGQIIHLHVSLNPGAAYRIQVYRLGWYGGSGARLIVCLPDCKKSKQGVERPTPTADPATGKIDARWPVTDQLRTRRDWVSGYYIAKLIVTSGPRQGKSNYVPFILRAPARHASPILVQASVNTWEAYNNWGGKSLYAYNSIGNAATKVSFNRPLGSAAQTPFGWEYQLVRFLEREGYDVSYTTDVDTDRTPGELLRHRLVIVSGHDEYWNKGMRDAFETARSRRVNLTFLGADIGHLQIRYEDSRRTIVEYRDAQRDPEQRPWLKTVEFEELKPPRPECTLLGVQNQGGFRGKYAQPRSFSVGPAALGDRWFTGTGFNSSSTLTDLVGYEWDSVKLGCQTPPLTILFHAAGPPDADAVRHIAPSGARVFSSGSLQFTWGLDDWGQSRRFADRRLQRFMKNAVDDLSGSHPK